MNGKANIVGMLWLAVGMTACISVLAAGVHVQSAVSVAEFLPAKILKSKQGVTLKSKHGDVWQIASVGDGIVDGSELATSNDSAIVDVGLGRRLEVGPGSRVGFMVVTRPGSIVTDMQVQVYSGFVVAEQPKSCKPCGTYIVRTNSSSFEVHRKERIGVQVLANGKGQEFDPKRGPAFRNSMVKELRVPGMSNPADLQVPQPVADANFGREWWIDRPWELLQFTTINIPLEPPKQRPNLNVWRPFIEVSEPTGFMERTIQDTSISTRPKVFLRVNTIMSVAKPTEDEGISELSFRLRGGYKTRDPQGDKLTVGTGVSAYKVKSFGHPLKEEVTIALDQLRPGYGSGWFPAKPRMEVEGAPFQITLPGGDVPAGFGRYIRGANRVGWAQPGGISGEGTVITNRGALVTVVKGAGSDRPEVNSLRRSLGGDLAVKGSTEDVVWGTPAEVAKQVFGDLNAGKTFFSARYNRVTPLDARRFPNQQSLENYLQATGSTILKKQLPVL